MWAKSETKASAPLTLAWPEATGVHEQPGRERELHHAEREPAHEARQHEQRARPSCESRSETGADERVLAEARARHGADDLPVERLAETEAARRRALEDDLQRHRSTSATAAQAASTESRRRSAGAAPVSTNASANVPPAARRSST